MLSTVSLDFQNLTIVQFGNMKVWITNVLRSKASEINSDTFQNEDIDCLHVNNFVYKTASECIPNTEIRVKASATLCKCLL